MGVLWNHSGFIERDANDQRAAAALAYFFTGGTTTPMAVYQDAAETTPHANPVVADSNGRWPNVFIPFVASYDLKVTTAGGTQLYYPTSIPNPDPVDVAAGAVTTSSSQINQTGDIKFRANSGAAPTGWVRLNGRTIGSASSGASERANADTSDLYTYLWDNFADALLAVTGGRGASAAADFAANKPMAVFDLRGAMPIGLDDMGNSASGRLSATVPVSWGDVTTGGSAIGADTHTLTTAQLASHTHAVGTLAAANESSHTHTGTTGNESADHTHSGTTSGISANHTHNEAYTIANNVTSGANTGGVTATPQATGIQSADHTHTITTGGISANHTHSFTSNAGSAHTHTLSGSTAAGGSGDPHNNVPSSLTGNWLIKL